MRKLDWFLAAVVATFLVGVAVAETANLTVSLTGLAAGRPDGIAEVTIHRLASRLPHPPILGVDPQ